MPMLFDALKINGVSLLLLPAGLANLAKSRPQTPLEQQRRQNVVVIVVIGRLACVSTNPSLEVSLIVSKLYPFCDSIAIFSCSTKMFLPEQQGNQATTKHRQDGLFQIFSIPPPFSSTKWVKNTPPGQLEGGYIFYFHLLGK